MDSVTREEINALRKQNIRPGVVGCFFHDKKVLFVYKEKHQLWQLPQGGIDNNEDIHTAFKREMAEELGEEFVSHISSDITTHGVDILRFPDHLHGSRKLVTDEGEEKIMQGKAYFFCRAEVDTENIDVLQGEFDMYEWLDLTKAYQRIDDIYQKGKQKITRNALNAVAG